MSGWQEVRPPLVEAGDYLVIPGEASGTVRSVAHYPDGRASIVRVAGAGEFDLGWDGGWRSLVWIKRPAPAPREAWGEGK